MRKEIDAGSPSGLLREKLVGFQREIAGLKRQLKEREEKELRRERELYVDIFDIVDIFDSIELNTRRRPEPLDKGGQRLLESMKAVRRRLIRLLGSRRIEPLDFPDRKAQPGQCAVAEARPAPGRENEEILAVLKRGWADMAQGVVLRKAEVVTVRNEERAETAG